MSAVQELAPALFDWLVRTSLDVAWLCLGVALVTGALGHRLGPRWRYALWSVVVLRIFVPQPLPQELTPSAPRLEIAAPSLWLAKTWKPEEQKPAPSSTPATPLVAKSPEVANPTLESSVVPSTPAPAPVLASGVPATAIAAPAPTAPSIATPFDPIALAVAIWLAVAVLLFALGAMREASFRRALRRARPADDLRVLALYDEQCRAARVQRAPRLLLASSIAAPCLTGWLDPRIALPEPSWRTFGRNALRHVFAHELAHFRRRDVARNWALHAIGCAFWFHPFIHWTLRRLRSTQEELCDLAAVPRGSRGASQRYAATLLRLSHSFHHVSRTSPTAGALSGARELRRRIRTVIRRQPTRPLVWVPALASLCALSWLGLTQAAEQASFVLPQVAAAAQEAPLSRIEVVKQQKEPAWRAPLLAKLRQTEATLEVQEAPFVEICAALAEQAGCSIVVHPSANDYGECLTTLRANASVETLLDRLTKHTDFAWALENGGVLLAPRNSDAFSTDVRFYRVETLLGHGEPELLAERLDSLRDLVVEVGAADSTWETQEVSIAPFRNALMVRQSDRVHALVHAFLEQLAARGTERAKEPSAQDAEARAQLEQTYSFRFEGASIQDVQGVLRERGLPIELGSDVLETGVEIHAVLNEVSGEDALVHIARLAGAHVEVRDGSIWLGCRPELEVQVFAVGDLLGASEDPDAQADRAGHLMDALRQVVDPRSWEMLETRISLWSDLLVVRQTQRNQVLVRETLDAMRRLLH